MYKLLSLALTILVCTLARPSSGQSACQNPNSRKGICISIYNCSSILSLIQKKPLSEANALFAKQSQCPAGQGRQPYVCCTSDVGFNRENISPQPITTMPSLPGLENPFPANGEGVILPSPPDCGQIPYGDKIYNGNDTQLDEFPWLVLLEYVQSNGKRILNCGGSLINQRYVLTAAHCVTGAILREVGRLDRVRLGEYDLSKTIDCVGADCADPILEVQVEEVIPHALFNDSSLDRQNDIALVRLNGVITYTNFIKPVCLPSVMGLRSTPRTGTNLIVAGWGRTLTSRQSNIKQKLYIPVNDHSECVQKFATKRIRISSSQICVGGRFIEDSCDGDSGGPLMQERGSYIQEGIVSFGNRCGLEGWPGVYTKVADFDQWIRDNLRP